jgi:hypothetical protein
MVLAITRVKRYGDGIQNTPATRRALYVVTATQEVRDDSTL